MNNKIIILGGPTASGKSSLALELADKINAVIINADSQQIYREIPIITAQPTIEEQKQIPHRLYGIISVRELFSVGLWLEAVKKEISHALEQEKTPLLVGGTGMYIKSLIEGIAEVPQIAPEIRQKVRLLCDCEGVEGIHKILANIDPQIAAKLNPTDKYRVLRAYEVFLETGKSLLYWQQQKTIPFFPKEMIKTFFLMPSRDNVYKKCNNRILKMLENGLLDELQAIDAMQIPNEFPAMRALGLPEFIEYINGIISLEEATSKAQQNTRQYVKRQFTWFRHQMPEATVLEEKGKLFKELGL
jgi:tRNA dimethylallyltransferase